MPCYLVVLNKQGRTEIITVAPGESAEQIAQDGGFVIVESYGVEAQAQERCAIENNFDKRALFVAGKLKVPKTPC